MNKLLGQRLRTLRVENGLTQEKIARGLGMSRQRYARIENGMTDITLEVLTNFAVLLNVDVGEITKVLDRDPIRVYRIGEEGGTAIDDVYEMLDLFYANKKVYERMHYREKE